jgi:hypothetical protein
MAWSRAEDKVRAFIERTQLPFLRSPMGKGMMADNHPLSVGALSLALQNVVSPPVTDALKCAGVFQSWIVATIAAGPHQRTLRRTHG